MRLSRLVAPGAALLVVALLVSGVLTPPTTEGLPSTPLATLVAVPLLRFAMFLTGSLALGAAVIGGPLQGGRPALQLAARASIGYAASSLLLGVSTLADVLARQWWDALDPRMLRSFFTQIDEGRYFVAQVVLGLVATWLLARARTWLDGSVGALLLGVAIALPAFSGHSAAAVSHWIASTVMIVHLLSVQAWVGGVLVLLLLPDRKALLAFGQVASVALPLALASGFASVVARVNDWAAFFHDRYALALLAKLALVAAVVALGSRMRRTVALAAQGHPGDLLTATRRTLMAEATLMVSAVAVAVVLARMANP